MRCRLSRVRSASSSWWCLDQVTSSRAVQQPLCRLHLCSMGAKRAACCHSHECFSCLTQGDCRKEVLFIFQHQGMLYSHKSILLKHFSQLPPHPKFNSPGMVKIMIFQLSQTSVYIPYGNILSPACIGSRMYLLRASFPAATAYRVSWAPGGEGTSSYCYRRNLNIRIIVVQLFFRNFQRYVSIPVSWFEA